MRIAIRTILAVIAALAILPLAVCARDAPDVELTLEDSETYTFSDDERRVILSIAEAALAEIDSNLEGVPDRIELVVKTGKWVIPQYGVNGAALAPNRIGWTVDPDHQDSVITRARAHLRSSLFHEAHHLARGWTFEDNAFLGEGMIAAAVSEGLATAFERDVAGGQPMWGQYPEDEVALWVEELLDVSGRDQHAYQDWMFRHPDGRWMIGYRAGTFIVDRAMAASGKTAAELVSTPTDEILELAGFGADTRTAYSPSRVIAEVTAAEAALVEVARSPNATARFEHFADDYVHTDSAGDRLTRAQMIEQHHNDPCRSRKEVSDQEVIPISSNAAVTRGRLDDRATCNDTAQSNRSSRYMALWRKRGGHWLRVAGQTTLIVESNIRNETGATADGHCVGDHAESCEDPVEERLVEPAGKSSP